MKERVIAIFRVCMFCGSFGWAVVVFTCVSKLVTHSSTRYGLHCELFSDLEHLLFNKRKPNGKTLQRTLCKVVSYGQLFLSLKFCCIAIKIFL